MTSVTLNEKYGDVLNEALSYAGVEARVIAASTGHRGDWPVVHATVLVKDLTDWATRDRVTETASDLEAEYRISVICAFRGHEV